MKVRFADQAPDGIALVIPASGTDAESVRRLGGTLADALTNQRFDGEPGSTAEHFHDKRRVLVVGTGKKATTGEGPEKLGGNTVAKLLTSGEKSAAITGPLIVCDCDHSIDVDPLFRAIGDMSSDCILSTWKLKNEDLRAWSVAAVLDHRVNGIAEKRAHIGSERDTRRQSRYCASRTLTRSPCAAQIRRPAHSSRIPSPETASKVVPRCARLTR